MVTGASWNLLPAPQCGGWGLTLPRTLTMIRLTVGELNEKKQLLFLDYLGAFSRGWGVQWNDYGGRCGICGDAWGDFPREHEAPLGLIVAIYTLYLYNHKFFKSGKYATGTLVRHYTSGAWVPVIVDITTNHGGYFAFKVARYSIEKKKEITFFNG